jgi:hypothetical protein
MIINSEDVSNLGEVLSNAAGQQTYIKHDGAYVRLQHEIPPAAVGGSRPKITKAGPALKIGGFTHKLGKVKAATIDLSEYAGKYVRIWLEADGTYSLDPRRDHFWQVAEFQVPEFQVPETKYKEVAAIDPGIGEPGGELVALPLDLTNMEITTFSLPE